MGQNHLLQTNPRDQFVKIPINNNDEHNSNTMINQTAISNRTRTIKWPTIITCIIFVLTGQSIARLLENLYYLHTTNKSRGTFIQSFLQVAGFPCLRIPLLFYRYYDREHPSPNRYPISSDRTSLKYLTLLYPCIGIIMVVQERLSARAKLEIPFHIFTLIYTTQLLFAPVFSKIINKIKFNHWIVISLIFSITAGSLTLYSSFPGEPNKGKERYVTGVLAASCAAITFSFLLSTIQNTFDNVIAKRDIYTNRKPSFSNVFELIFFSSIATAVVSMTAMFITGEHFIIKRDIRGFSAGRRVYGIIMMGQIAAWQIYWIGLVGLVYGVSSLFSNVISVSTWPVVSVLAVLFFNFGKNNEFDVFKGIALTCAFLSVVSYLYTIHKEKKNNDETTS